MERRRHTRQAAAIKAVLQDLAGSQHDCLIRDFSQGGLLATFEPPLPTRDMEILRLPGSAAGWPCVNLAVPGGETLRLEIEVVRLSPQMSGLRFIHQDPQYLAALRQLADGAEQPRHVGIPGVQPGHSQPSHAARSNLTRASNREFGRFLEERLRACFSQIDEALLSAADHSLAAAQNMFLDAMGLLRKQQPLLIRQLIERLCSHAMQISQGGYAPPGEDSSDDQHKRLLALVEKHDFENWLAVRVAISKAELQLRDQLIELQLRLDAAFGQPGGARIHNPYSPAAIANSLYEFVQPLQLNGKVIELLFENLQTQVLSRLDDLYRVLNQLFIDADILPNIDITASLTAQAIQQRRSTAPPSTGTATHSQPIVAAAIDTAAVAQVAPAPQDSPAATPRDAMGTASRLRSLQRQPGSSPGVTTTATSQPGSEVFKALSRLQRHLLVQPVDAVPLPLRQQLLNASDNQHELSEHEQDSADMVESLFDCITQNERLQEDLRPELRKLQVPILGLMLKDPELFTSDFHPARQIINCLAMLADRNSHSLERNTPAIRAAIHAILAGDGDEAGFARALGLLEPWVSREQKLIERNIVHLREVHDGQQRLRDANAAIERALHERLDTPVHQPVIELLEYGWKDLLRLSYLREGENSRPWSLALKAIERLMQFTAPGYRPTGAAHHAAPSLLRLIDTGLSRVPEQHARHATLKASLAQLLNSPADATEPLVSYQPQPSDSAQLQAQLDNLLASDRSLQRWIKRAGNLRSGQWFELTHEDLQAQLSQLIWISADGYRLVFANQQATHGRELTLDQVALMLRDEQLNPLTDAALPAVEQGLDALVQRIYDKLAFDSSHDQLTGLCTRKEFCRLLAQSAAHAREHGSSHTLIFIDIQQFKVINNTCGYEAGDRLLREVALHIKSLLSDDACAGRMGPDQFALLLAVNAETHGFQQASRLKQEIEDNRFLYEGQSFVINLALSLGGFDRETPRVMELLRRVEAATGLSKKSGHKGIRLVRPGDERLEELDEVMGWVTRINRALDTNSLRIRCQQIIPTPANAGEQLHFETLLTVVDERGEHIPPTEFIKVAEEYNRMGAVDRWVISTVLAWMHDNRPLLDRFGGFSINLSGHSMNDDTFPDFLFEALVQYQIPRNKLVFEITETTAVANLEDAADFIEEMRNIGCRFSLDDFGVGQSSYAYLKRLPVDFIKIDGAFVHDINNNDIDYALVRSITEMGHYLGKQVIAEYVSSEAIHTAVSDIGVDYAQGHLFGQPVTLDQLAESLLQMDPL